MDLRIGQVSLDCPRLQVPVQPRTDVVQSEIQLHIRRVGMEADFASYSPISAIGNVLVFQFDSLLFDGQYGRYAGTLVFNNTPYLSLQFEYTPAVSINSALQLSTVGPYRKPREYGNPDWSGTGVSGPGTFIGLKDTPKTYGGAAGQLVCVRELENGLGFIDPSALIAGVTSVNAAAGAVNIVAGANVTVSTEGGSITIAASGGGSSGVATVVAGVNAYVNDTDPHNPIVSGPPVYAPGQVPAAPSEDGVFMIYLGLVPGSGNSFAGGAAYSLSGQWIDLFGNDVIPPGS